MITKLFSTLTLFATLIVALSGCISAPRQPFNKSANQTIKKIAVVGPQAEKFHIGNIGGAGGAFGSIGAAVEIAETERKSNEFTQQMKVQQLSMGTELTRAVKEQLESDGYEVTILSGQQPVALDDSELDFAYAGIRTDADAILHVWFANPLGYISPPGLTDYIPRVNVRARLLAANTKAQLYFQMYMYGWNPDVENLEHVPAHQMYSYGDFDTLIARSQEAAEGLRLGAQEVAVRIGLALK